MTEIVRVANTEKPDRTADVVFLHGLNGDAWLTWGATREGNEYSLKSFWPRWIGEDFQDLGVWSVQYDAASSNWTGSAMPIGDRATNVLELLAVSGLGKRPLIFITHSMGGLIVKQMLHDLHTNTNVAPDWKPIYSNTRGIAFFSTPHNGSLPARALRQFWPLRPSPNIAELAANNPHLRKLNHWFRNNIDPLRIRLLIYCELDPPLDSGWWTRGRPIPALQACQSFPSTLITSRSASWRRRTVVTRLSSNSAGGPSRCQRERRLFRTTARWSRQPRASWCASANSTARSR